MALRKIGRAGLDPRACEDRGGRFPFAVVAFPHPDGPRLAAVAPRTSWDMGNATPEKARQRLRVPGPIVLASGGRHAVSVAGAHLFPDLALAINGRRADFQRGRGAGDITPECGHGFLDDSLLLPP